MDIILLEDVEKLGSRGEVVSASDGYARNYLLPRKLAEIATPGKVEEIKRHQEAEEQKKSREAGRADDLVGMLGKTVLTINVQAGEDGRLFGSVTAADIAEEIEKARKVRIDKKKVRLEDPIKETGDYMVEVEVHAGKTATMKVIVAAAE
ncbi:50S ribosomal protein L9 [bacterium BMS3Abin01]|nr:50S ribosomal protein L9 [bacterium BMS3Abin01]HDZ59158.1 50S ribosomal protein L9 [Actinomycetota bacterium]